jgi:hypothetical protein
VNDHGREVRSLELVRGLSHLHSIQAGQMGTGSCLLGVKRTWREAYHSPPSGAVLRKTDLHLHFPIRLQVTVRK